MVKIKSNSIQKIILSIDGGIGKCIAASAVCKAVKKQFPKSELIVISGYPEVFLANPNITESYQSGNAPYFYSKHIDGKDVKLMLHNPYLEEAYVQEKSHLIRIWCEMFGLKYNNELPEIFLTKREIEFYQKKYESNKPIMLLQANGGFVKEMKYSWARDLPVIVVDKIIQHFSEKYNIVHIKREDQLGYAKTMSVSANFREIAALALLSKKRLLIDSFLQHTCAALNLPSTVCWIANNPKVLGYELHHNIIANKYTKKPELKNSFLSKFSIIGEPVEFPYNSEDEIFDIDKIIASLEK